MNKIKIGSAINGKGETVDGNVEFFGKGHGIGRRLIHSVSPFVLNAEGVFFIVTYFTMPVNPKGQKDVRHSVFFCDTMCIVPLNLNQI